MNIPIYYSVCPINRFYESLNGLYLVFLLQLYPPSEVPLVIYILLKKCIIKNYGVDTGSLV